MPKLYDISKWPSEISDVVTIGKRIKSIVYQPGSFREYYFKEPKADFPTEFWTEVIASKIGKDLGFDVITYHVAICNDSVGCISKSMINADETLIHGQQYLTSLMPDFEYDMGKDHTFQLVEKFFGGRKIYNKMIYQFIEMLIFDAIIGNRDRHQQNWAIIQPNRTINLTERLRYTEFIKKIRLPRFSPIFDNGNCLAYNVLDVNLHKYLENEQFLDKYLFGRKAISHVRWEGAGLTHIELIKKINQKYPEIVKPIVERVRFNKSKLNIQNIIENIDEGIIFVNEKYSLSQNRKKLITLLLEKRLQRLLETF